MRPFLDRLPGMSSGASIECGVKAGRRPPGGLGLDGAEIGAMIEMPGRLRGLFAAIHGLM
jgi:hypothetical protein